jgi:hypothetical protein
MAIPMQALGLVLKLVPFALFCLFRPVDRTAPAPACFRLLALNFLPDHQAPLLTRVIPVSIAGLPADILVIDFCFILPGLAAAFATVLSLFHIMDALHSSLQARLPLFHPVRPYAINFNALQRNGVSTKKRRH